MNPPVSALSKKPPPYLPTEWFEEEPSWEDSLLKVMEAVDCFQRLREHDALPECAKYLRNQTIDKAFDTISEVVHIATNAPSLSADTEVERARTTLDQDLQDAFEQYVPDANQQDILHAVASVLSHFNIEDGEINQIAARLRKRRERAQKQ